MSEQTNNPDQESHPEPFAIPANNGAIVVVGDHLLFTRRFDPSGADEMLTMVPISGTPDETLAKLQSGELAPTITLWLESGKIAKQFLEGVQRIAMQLERHPDAPRQPLPHESPDFLDDGMDWTGSIGIVKRFAGTPASNTKIDIVGDVIGLDGNLIMIKIPGGDGGEELCFSRRNGRCTTDGAYYIKLEEMYRIAPDVYARRHRAQAALTAAQGGMGLDLVYTLLPAMFQQRPKAAGRLCQIMNRDYHSGHALYDRFCYVSRGLDGWGQQIVNWHALSDDTKKAWDAGAAATRQPMLPLAEADTADKAKIGRALLEQGDQFIPGAGIRSGPQHSDVAPPVPPAAEPVPPPEPPTGTMTFPMDPAKIERLEAAGWKVGTASEFVGTPIEQPEPPIRIDRESAEPVPCTPCAPLITEADANAAADAPAMIMDPPVKPLSDELAQELNANATDLIAAPTLSPEDQAKLQAVQGDMSAAMALHQAQVLAETAAQSPIGGVAPIPLDSAIKPS